MIDLHSYLLFIVASVLLIIVPGPDMIYMLSRSIAQGRRAGLVAGLGINLGGYVHLTATVLGLSAILATSSLAFTFITWAGVLERCAKPQSRYVLSGVPAPICRPGKQRPHVDIDFAWCDFERHRDKY